LNLQDCDKIINYDLHWNPVRLIQRFGRIDRIGSEFESIQGYNFLPEVGIERNLGLTAVLKDRIRDIHETIGEDTKILDSSEQLNEQAMYAIYEGDSAALSALEDDDSGGLVSLNEAEEFMRRLKQDDPGLFKRISEMRDGVRSCKRAKSSGTFVFCEASSDSDDGQRNYQQLYLVDANGKLVTRDLQRVLGVVKCEPDEPSVRLPKEMNQQLMRVRRDFAEEVKHRESELQHSVSLSRGQRYVLQQLRLLFSQASDEETKGQLNLLERIFRRPLTAALRRELNSLKSHNVQGPVLINQLRSIYRRHGLARGFSAASNETPKSAVRVVCGEGLSS